MPSDEEIRLRAYYLYLDRTGEGLPGSAEDDWLLAVPAARAGGRRAGLGACRPGDGGVGVGGEGAEGVCVDYALRPRLMLSARTAVSGTAWLGPTATPGG